MPRSDRLLVDTLRRSVAARLLAGDDPARVRAELMDRVGRSFAKAYQGPDLAPLLPGKLELARAALDGQLAALKEAGRGIGGDRR